MAATLEPARAEPRERFAAVVDAEVLPRAAEFDRAGAIPGDVLRLAAHEGWWGAAVAGQDWRTVGALHEEVGRGCSSLRSLLTVHTMVAWAVRRWGSEAQQARWLGVLRSGEVLGAFCLTEPEAGSDAAAIETAAVTSGDGFVLEGTKVWVTGGQVAGLFLVFARSERGLAAFLVPHGTPGLEVVPIEGALGTRASMLAQVSLSGCRVGPEALLGPDGFGLATVATGALDVGRYSVACGCVGIVQACLDASAEHAAARQRGGAPIADRQLVRRMLSDMVVDVRAARLLCVEAGRLKDDDDPATIMATWVAKYHASRAAARAAADAVQIHGAAGCAEGHRAGRLYRDAKVMEIIEGSTQLQQLTIADDAFRGRRP
ncbi:MAG TPA: acyl-CoA dehydrogenase family protein [Solirubrobacteraceae bacterium]|nr:acyl-CoA dehydrogenase family protein [Solirubrobacteraceae bacterium]